MVPGRPTSLELGSAAPERGTMPASGSRYLNRKQNGPLPVRTKRQANTQRDVWLVARLHMRFVLLGHSGRRLLT